jgi:hypothetical protein
MVRVGCWIAALVVGLLVGVFILALSSLGDLPGPLDPQDAMWRQSKFCFAAVLPSTPAVVVLMMAIIKPRLRRRQGWVPVALISVAYWVLLYLALVAWSLATTPSHGPPSSDPLTYWWDAANVLPLRWPTADRLA